MIDPLDIAGVMGDLARRLQAEESIEDTLQAMTASAVTSVPGAELAGVTLVRDRHNVETRAATDRIVQMIDAAQYETGEGPCLSALWEHHTVDMPDIMGETRWPRLIARLGETGVRSMMCFQLYVRDRNLAALNLYSSRKSAFDDESRAVGELFAAHAAVALAAIQQTQQLHRALDTRDVIGMAKGVLMERFKVTPDAAFQMLVRASQQHNIKLNQVADLVLHTGQSPDEAAGS
jgi:GAF domain-containing protein